MDHKQTKNRRGFVGFGLLLVGALACNAPSAAQITPTPTGEIAPTITASPQSTSTTGVTQAASATSASQPTAPSQPTTPPQTGEPIFTALVFNDQPSAATSKGLFPTGTEEIWAIWNYANMRQGMIVKRVWIKDDEVWLEREEPWDFAKYGESGTVTDISIYDRDQGLAEGSYLLQLFIDGNQQNVGEHGIPGFVIASTADQEFPGDGDQVAIVRDLGTLILTDANGQEKVLAQELEIISVQWFPDNKRILYVALDRSMAPLGPTLEWKWRLWVIVLATGEKYPLSEESEKLHDPALSPQGDIIALVKGTGYGDAGFVDSELVFMYLDASFKRNTTKSFTEFQGIPAGSEDGVYPVQFGISEFPGEWAGIAEFDAGLAATINAPNFDSGVYAFFTKEMIAQRLGDLPPN